MAFNREAPYSFGLALDAARKILSKNAELIQKQLVEPEAEQIVLAAFRLSTGKVFSRVELFSMLSDPFPPDAGRRVLVMAGSRAEGVPLQYLIGTQAFLDHEYEVNPSVLIPRPETEVLAMFAISEIAKFKSPPHLGLEIGLGSGVLSIELLCRFPELRMIASELTSGAEATALRNAQRILGSQQGLGGSPADRLKVVRAAQAVDVWQAFSGHVSEQSVDFVISNPPYLTRQDSIDSDVLSHEPSAALFAPESDPLHFYREISLQGRRFLRSGGMIFTELPSERARVIVELFEKNDWRVRLEQDLAERERVLIAHM